MSKNTSTPSTTPGDDGRIDIDAEGQAERWAREFRVSADELRDAVRTVGDEVEKVREFLAGGGNRVP
jgi:hypothetical protein